MAELERRGIAVQYRAEKTGYLGATALDEQEQQARIERAEKAVSFLARLAVSLVLPLWGLVMLILGVEDGSGWWIGTGVAVCAVGILFLAGGPLADAFLREP